MTFSFTSFFTIMFFSSLLIILIWFFLKSNKIIKQIGISSLVFFILIIIIRLLTPFELSFAKELPLDGVFPEIIFFFKTPIIKFDGLDICFNDILYFIFAIGALITLFKTLQSYNQFKRLIIRLPTVSNTHIKNALKKVLQKYNNPISFKIVQASFIPTPMIFGIRKPRIILPEIELSEKEWYHILSHEIVHYYNGDLQLKLITELLCIIYWWNPFIYLLKKQITKALEIHTDFTVTKSLNELEKVEYLECLLKIARNQTNGQFEKVILTFANENSCTLSQRFHMILDDCNLKNKEKFKYIFLTVSTVILFTILSYLLVFEPYSISPQDEYSTVELTMESAYLVQNKNNSYDLYLNDQYFGTVSEIKDSYSNLPIYKNIKEVKNK